jgi:LmbE family N-acetylglucosaminyl deacetylase
VRLLHRFHPLYLARARASRSMLRASEVLHRMVDLPYADLHTIIGSGTTLLLAPHPDDESLGCGGLIAEACSRNNPPVVVVLTDGTMSHPSSLSHPRQRLKALREAETRTAVEILGLPADRLFFLGFPDGGAPREGSGRALAAAQVAHLVRLHGATSILATWEHDPHDDHLAAHLIAQEAAHLTGARLVSYPVWGWTLPPRHLLPNQTVQGARLDIARYQAVKRRAIAAHASQHPGLIVDDPDGFHLKPDMLTFHNRTFEVFLFSPDVFSAHQGQRG